MAERQRRYSYREVILGEVQNVISAMRLNTRWSSRQLRRSGQSESPLMKNLKLLRTQLESPAITDLSKLDGAQVMLPFLEVIRSKETSGPITGVALEAVHKFVQYGIIEAFPTYDHVICSIVEAVTSCRFEATDPDLDAVVLMMIVKVLQECLLSKPGEDLTDELVHELVQTAFTMAIQLSLSVLLRKTAEMSLVQIIQCIFSRYCKEPLSPGYY
eukprot:TRINITY_DN16101_c0_g1_i1.p1 TRINITY_DN16101_c0_g1~~TRINITY_DN16101_c0_g1_i1.p1  ORF type:complete len:236 (+),score=19.96 TRINITY_DN16101_c0_g1_i1:64-708(+)